MNSLVERSSCNYCNLVQDIVENQSDSRTFQHTLLVIVVLPRANVKERAPLVMLLVTNAPSFL